MPNIDSKYYSLPAGIYSDHPSSFALGTEEKKVLKIMKIEKIRKKSRYVEIQKDLKSVVMGATMVQHLLNHGQVPPLTQILSYLNWYQLAVLFIVIGPSSLLCCLVKKLLSTIFIDNTQFAPAGAGYINLLFLFCNNSTLIRQLKDYYFLFIRNFHQAFASISQSKNADPVFHNHV